MDGSTTLAGSLTRDPELRYTTSGRAVAGFGIAVNRRYQVNGEWTEDTSFLNVKAWGDLGEHVAASLRKGDRVVVLGRLEQRSWEDKDGGKRSAVEVVAHDIGASVRFANVEVRKIARDPQASAEVA